MFFVLFMNFIFITYSVLYFTLYFTPYCILMKGEYGVKYNRFRNGNYDGLGGTFIRSICIYVLTQRR